MGLKYRALRICISIVNIIIALLVITSIWPFATGDFSVDLPEESEIDWSYVGGVITLSAPVSINNGGFYSIDDVVVRSTVTNSTQYELINSTESWGRIPVGVRFSETIDFSIDLEDLLSAGAYWMIFNPDFFEINIRISCRYTLGLIGFSADYSMPYSWDGLIRDFGFGQPELANPSPGNFEIRQPYWIWTNSILSGLGGDFTLELRDESTGNLTASSTDHISLGMNYSDTLALTIAQVDYLYLLTNNETFEATIIIELPGLPPMQEIRQVNWVAPIYW